MITYIYSLKHPITNEVRYVGKTTSPNRRYKEHIYKLNKTDHKTNWIKSLLLDGLKPIMCIIEECIGEWEDREKYWITQFNNLTNLSDGGGKCSMSDEVKEKIRQANLGKVLSEETKAKISEANLGEKNHRYGKSLTKEEIRFLHEKRLEFYQVRKSLKEPKIKKSQNKPCQINNILYESISKASKETGVPKGTIHRRLNSKNFSEYIWKFQ